MNPANITMHFSMFTCPLIEESMASIIEDTKLKKGSGESTKGTISIFLIEKI